MLEAKRLLRARAKAIKALQKPRLTALQRFEQEIEVSEPVSTAVDEVDEVVESIAVLALTQRSGRAVKKPARFL
jgi:hypothetical protein